MDIQIEACLFDSQNKYLLLVINYNENDILFVLLQSNVTPFQFWKLLCLKDSQDAKKILVIGKSLYLHQIAVVPLASVVTYPNSHALQ